MEDMAHVNIKMHMGNRSLAPNKKHGVIFNKPFHQVLRPGKILDQFRRMLKNIKQEIS